MESSGGRSQTNERTVQDIFVSEMIEAAERKLEAIAVDDDGPSRRPTGCATSTSTTFTGADCTREVVRIYTSSSRTPNYTFDNARRITSERRRPKPYVRKKKEQEKGVCQEDAVSISAVAMPRLLGSPLSSTDTAPNDNGESWQITYMNIVYCLESTAAYRFPHSQ